MSVLYVLAAIVILGLIVAVHEFGHYIAGRLCGIGILEYSIGFGPRLLGFERGGIKYSLRLIPLGGYCAFLGEDEGMDDPRAMRNQPVWKRLVTTAAGPLMNFVLAFLLMIVFYNAFDVYQSAPVLYEVVEGSAAQEAGLEAGDVIVSVNGERLTCDPLGQAQLISTIRAAGAQEVSLEIDRGGELLKKTLVPEYNEQDQAYQIGILLGTVPVRLNFVQSLQQSGYAMLNMSTMMVDALRQMFTSKEVIEQTMGPVGIISTVSQDMRQGADMVLNWAVVISLNLGIMNLLPVPGLDGGRILFLIIEGIRRKPIPVEKEAWVHAGGLLLLLGLIVVITFRDVARIFTGG
ncbi:MAG: RIP metalloprotease RseP [Eubacteriales bacterium]|nr:RIP metalloprotease RseP [Eubacteriales bacterium]